MTAQLARGASRVAPVGDRSIDDLDLEICRLVRQMNAKTYRMLRLVRDFDDRFGFAKWGFASCAEWLAWRCGLSLSAAREKVRTAQALRALPAISAAFADGRLSYSKVRALTRVAATHDEDLLLAYALEATASQVEERCRQIRNVEPDSVHAARQAWERRSLTLFRDRSRGVVRITIELPEAEGELVGRALENAVAAGDVANGVEFMSSAERAVDGWRAQQADALVAIVKGYLGSRARADANPSAEGDTTDQRSAASASSADHCQIVVHVDEKALRGEAGRSDLPIDTVKRLACDASLVTVVEDERGAPLDVGRKQRTVTTALRRALWSRDRGCSFPGCHRTRYVDAHHIHHWAEGGDTSLDNLTLLCTHHHTLLHEGGFSIRRDSADGIYFRRPDGRVIPRSGYRADDILDDVAVALPGANPSSEARVAAIVHGFEIDDEPAAAAWARSTADRNPSAEGWATSAPTGNPSAEVREGPGKYRVRVAAPQALVAH